MPPECRNIWQNVCLLAPLEIKKHFKDEADENVEEVSTNLKDIKSYN